MWGTGAKCPPEARFKTNKGSRRSIMKTIVSAVLALSVLVGIAAAPASAFDARQFWDEHPSGGQR
jgi:hypothetical protein